MAAAADSESLRSGSSRRSVEFLLQDDHGRHRLSGSTRRSTPDPEEDMRLAMESTAFSEEEKDELILQLRGQILDERERAKRALATAEHLVKSAVTHQEDLQEENHRLRSAVDLLQEKLQAEKDMVDFCLMRLGVTCKHMAPRMNAPLQHPHVSSLPPRSPQVVYRATDPAGRQDGAAERLFRDWRQQRREHYVISRSHPSPQQKGPPPDPASSILTPTFLRRLNEAGHSLGTSQQLQWAGGSDASLSSALTPSQEDYNSQYSTRVTVASSSGSAMSSPRSALSEDTQSWMGWSELQGQGTPTPTSPWYQHSYGQYEAVTLTPSIAEGRQRVETLRQELRQLEGLQRDLDLDS